MSAAVQTRKGRSKRLGSRVDLERLREKLRKRWDPERSRIYVCMGTGCKACGGTEVVEAIEAALRRSRLSKAVDVIITGCHGFCENGTLVLIQPLGIFYTRVTADDARQIVDMTIRKGKPVTRLLYKTQDGKHIQKAEDIPFYSHQERVALGLNGHIDPTDIGDYIREGGYMAITKALFDMKPDEVIEEITESGLKGRGGGGFPTGLKWRFCREAPGDEKYIICNADEGDPGAFMDRSLMEGNPGAVIEGMIIGAYAIGARLGYVYIRAEYPLAIERLRIALDQARELGLLGENILGSGTSFDILIKEGAGAFVCGEETALIRSIEGNRGMPRPRPPFPATKGLFDKPTNINNVETWGNVPLIITRGADWFASIGTEGSKGTKIFSLVGKVNNTGLVEVPMGMSLRELVDDIGGGVMGGGKLKAVQTGGPSGGCIPARLMDLPIDYESLARAGSIMGSGGLVVMDENTCMVDLARYFLTFTQNESCGECTPCRLGTRRMLDILENICAGKGVDGDIEKLEQMGRTIQNTSLCGLGQTAPNPALTTIKYFRQEYEEHIHAKHCRATVCKSLVDAPCNHTCPAGVKAHRYVREISRGNFENAYLVVRESMPLPSACGTVCFHPCETRCKRGQLDQAIAVRALKGAAVRYGASAEKRIPTSRRRTGKKVAVVGSGPAGLTAAYYLSKKGGHDVTILEELPVVGGMLHTGIPRYRLPRKDLDRDIAIVRAAGVKIKTRTRVESVDRLRKQGFDAVFLSLGAHGSWPLGVPGQKAEGVWDCVQFLRSVSTNRKVRIGKRVVVVGGGNSAIDAARTARRLGAKVTILYRRTREEMPADHDEIEDALAEGVVLETLTLPVKVRKVGDGLRVTCQRMRLGEIDASGRRRPVPVEGSEFTVDVDTILSAIGQFPLIPKKLGVEISAHGQRIAVDESDLSTSAKGVFAGGDVVSGPASVVEAIAHGRRAAIAIDRFLGGDGNIDEQLAPAEDLEGLPALKAETRARPRPKMGHLSPSSRTRHFRQVEKGYSKAEAIKEAGRCLRCDLED
jgi:NADH-quinone oxidoreductase subunit F